MSLRGSDSCPSNLQCKFICVYSFPISQVRPISAMHVMLCMQNLHLGPPQQLTHDCSEHCKSVRALVDIWCKGVQKSFASMSSATGASHSRMRTMNRWSTEYCAATACSKNWRDNHNLAFFCYPIAYGSSTSAGKICRRDVPVTEPQTWHFVHIILRSRCSGWTKGRS